MRPKRMCAASQCSMGSGTGKNPGLTLKKTDSGSCSQSACDGQMLRWVVRNYLGDGHGMQTCLGGKMHIAFSCGVCSEQR
jgi:hypothetical protein